MFSNELQYVYKTHVTWSPVCPDLEMNGREQVLERHHSSLSLPYTGCEHLVFFFTLLENDTIYNTEFKL